MKHWFNYFGVTISYFLMEVIVTDLSNLRTKSTCKSCEFHCVQAVHLANMFLYMCEKNAVINLVDKDKSAQASNLGNIFRE